MDSTKKELFLSGAKFSTPLGSLYFNYEHSPNGGILCVSVRMFTEGEYFGNVSKIDSKGFNYYTYILPSEKKIAARVSFSNLTWYGIDLPKEEKEVQHA